MFTHSFKEIVALVLDTSCCPLSGAQSITNPHNSSHRRKCDCLSFLPFCLLVQPMLQAALCETDAYCPSDNLGWRATWDSICGPARRRLSQHASCQCSLDYLSPYGSWHLHAPPSSRFCASVYSPCVFALCNLIRICLTSWEDCH